MTLEAIKQSTTIIDQDQESRLVIVEPEGPQGRKLGLEIRSGEQFQAFDQEVGKLPKAKRTRLASLESIARRLGINVIKP